MTATNFSRAQENRSKNDFAYTTLNSIRVNQGISSDDLSDASALWLISVASLYINTITSEWFEPVRLATSFTGRGTPFLNLYGVPPLILLKSAEILKERTLSHRQQLEYTSPNSTIYDGAIEERYLSLSPDGRALQLSISNWPMGLSNIILHGWFGRVEPVKYLSTVCGSGVSSGTSSVSLGATTLTPAVTFGTENYDTVQPVLGYDNSFRERDVVIFLDSNERELARRHINSIDYDTNIITFDPLPSNPISAINSGTKVVTFGSVPKLIEVACNKIVADNQDNSDLLSRGIKQEKTDHYQYTRFTSLEMGSPVFDEISSSPFVNNILYHYSSPGYVSM